MFKLQLIISKFALGFRALLGNIFFVIIVPFLKLALNPNRAYVLLIDRKRQQVLLLRQILGLYAWKLPGGGLKRGETHRQAVCREIQEETNIQINPQNLKELYIQRVRNWSTSGRHVYYLYFCSKEEIDYAKNPREILQISWKSWHIKRNLSKPLNEILIYLRRYFQSLQSIKK
ncbi:MAG: NUDIX hydrolase [Candidatus Saccharibacteria bacterium]|nr:NUDIX hydrolase [Candidatus Saccharibacteria bacterium]